MQEIAARSKMMQAEQFPDIGWERSHVCSDDGGALKAFCVYVAPSPERLKEHTDSVGGLVITNIYEIVGEIATRRGHDLSLGSAVLVSRRAWNRPW